MYGDITELHSIFSDLGARVCIFVTVAAEGLVDVSTTRDYLGSLYLKGTRSSSLETEQLRIDKSPACHHYWAPSSKPPLALHVQVSFSHRSY